MGLSLPAHALTQEEIEAIAEQMMQQTREQALDGNYRGIREMQLESSDLTTAINWLREFKMSAEYYTDDMLIETEDDDKDTKELKRMNRLKYRESFIQIYYPSDEYQDGHEVKQRRRSYYIEDLPRKYGITTPTSEEGWLRCPPDDLQRIIDGLLYAQEQIGYELSPEMAFPQNFMEQYYAAMNNSIQNGRNYGASLFSTQGSALPAGPVVSSAVLGFLAGGLVVWAIMRKKKNAVG